ncbi:MAG TPA: hypothetical protein VMA71_07040 [Alloacidobacterium sp.]|nr:hypothetical protein [Alloacidobacterium sp.]
MIEEMTTDEQIREDANDVLNAAVSYAKRMLRRYGEFAPFAYRMNLDGNTQLEVVAQHDMPPEPAMLLGLLYEQLTERARKALVIAAAVASNVTMTKATAEGFTDAVMVEIEHRRGYCVRAFVPYRITGGQFHRLFPRVVKFGELHTQEGTPRLFGQ